MTELYNFTVGKKLNPNDIREFIEKTDGLFFPKLSERLNIGEYIAKLGENALFSIIEYDSKTIIGLCAFYANNVNAKDAYLPYIAIMPDYQGLGLGKELIKKTIAYLKEKGFMRLTLEASEERGTILFYEKLGFHIIEKIYSEKLSRTSVKLSIAIF